MKNLWRLLTFLSLLMALLIFEAFRPIEQETNLTKMNQFGICHLSTVTVRGESSHRSELVTQLLFGETYQVLAQSEDEEWLKIKMDYDAYEGWIPAFQHFQVSEGYHEAFQSASHAILKDAVAELNHPELGRHLLSAGSTLPFFRDGKVRLGEEEFSLEVSAGQESNDLVAFAHTYLHTPYLWGGRSIFGIDCSGYVQQVYRATEGVHLPRDAYQQAEIGQEVSFEARTEGDLAFFKNAKGRIVHVGIVLTGGKIIHASGKVRIDNLTPEGIVKPETGEQTHVLASVKRLSPNA